MTVEAQTEQQPRPTPGLAMLTTLGGISMLSGLLVVLVFQYTKPIIAENQRIRTEKAVFQVVPGAASKGDFVLTDAGILPAGEDIDGAALYAAYDGAGVLKGIAFPGAAQGYQDTIQFLFGYDPSCQCIIGSKVLKSTETPGLGDKIDQDPAYLENFKALDASLNADGSGLANAIVTVKHGTKSEPWQIDAISGATISSNAMGRALNDAAQRFAPAVQRDLTTMLALRK